MAAMSPPPINSPFIDLRTGIVTRPWLQWFAQNFARIGGAIALSNTELEALTITLHEEPNDPFGGLVAEAGAFESIRSIEGSIDPFGQQFRAAAEQYFDTEMLLARIVALEQRIATLEALEGFA